ncbi:unnamed protein product [Didymodactylos carnosus]|uniref:RING-type domain-containing protein n=1 Tax=Didymodactylos carnosus TaxID=1234261 RepID=A0A8S2D6Y3_9BILA|nr:unnamed protein product [Didymodactylos carnosus]CAF3642826.1 unnamed protein product [Didymodactylos carnosus]
MSVVPSDDVSIDRDRIVDDKVSDEFFCPICRTLLWNPVACKTCENTFCRRCINQWLAQKDAQNRCVFNCRYAEKRCSPALKSLLSKLLLSCQYKRSGCSQSILYESIEKHELQCEYQAKNCRGCKKNFTVKDLRQHEDYCEHIEVECEICHCKIKQTQVKFHVFKCVQKQLLVDINKLLEKSDVEQQNEFQELHKTVQTLQQEFECLQMNLVLIKSALENGSSKLMNTWPEYQNKISVLEDTIRHTEGSLMAHLAIVGSKTYDEKTTNDINSLNIVSRIDTLTKLVHNLKKSDIPDELRNQEECKLAEIKLVTKLEFVIDELKLMKNTIENLECDRSSLKKQYETSRFKQCIVENRLDIVEKRIQKKNEKSVKILEDIESSMAKGCP